MTARKLVDEVEPDYKIRPVLLFNVKRTVQEQVNDEIRKRMDQRGVYYVPQRGVALEGIENDWSVLTVCKTLNKEHFEEFEPHEIDPGRLSQESIIQALAAWMSTEDIRDVKEEEEEEE